MRLTILAFYPLPNKANPISGSSLFWTFFSEIPKYPLVKVQTLLTASTIQNLCPFTKIIPSQLQMIHLFPDGWPSTGEIPNLFLVLVSIAAKQMITNRVFYIFSYGSRVQEIDISFTGLMWKCLQAASFRRLWGRNPLPYFFQFPMATVFLGCSPPPPSDCIMPTSASVITFSSLTLTLLRTFQKHPVIPLDPPG